MADLGEEAFSSQMKVVATFLRLLEELIYKLSPDGQIRKRLRI